MKKAVLIAFLATASAVALPIAAVSAAAAPEAKAASCARGTKPAIIAGNFKCLRVGLKCSASYQSAYRKYGFHCAKSRLRKGTGTSVPPSSSSTPPAGVPDPPRFQSGHYKGVTSQNETIEFDIRPGFGASSDFYGLKTGQINEGCTPQFHIRGNYLSGYYAEVQWGGDFILDKDLTGWHVGDSPATEHLTIRGHMNGQAGSGSLELKTTFVADGVAYSCGSGLQTWTVTRIGSALPAPPGPLDPRSPWW